MKESLLLLALDWAKAFDSIDPGRLLHALERFGLPRHMVEVIGAIYHNRSFFVRMEGNDSGRKKQSSGIVQGCPLSPFLFSIAMTCLLSDVDRQI